MHVKTFSKVQIFGKLFYFKANLSPLTEKRALVVEFRDNVDSVQAFVEALFSPLRFYLITDIAL